MALPRGTYRFASPVSEGRCPVEVGGYACTLAPNHAPLECAHVTAEGTRALGVVPVPTSAAMKDPADGTMLPAAPRSAEDRTASVVGPTEHEDGSEWFARHLAAAGPCECLPSEHWPSDLDVVCTEQFGCALCRGLPPDWPCPADGGYGLGALARGPDPDPAPTAPTPTDPAPTDPAPTQRLGAHALPQLAFQSPPGRSRS